MQELIAKARTHLKTLSDDEFERQYKSSKRRYQAVTKSLDWLHELKESLEQQEDLDIDADIITDVEVLIQDLTETLDRMHSAHLWIDDEEDYD